MKTQNTILLKEKQFGNIVKWARKNKELVDSNFYPFLMNGAIVVDDMDFYAEQKVILTALLHKEIQTPRPILSFEITELGDSEYNLKLDMADGINTQPFAFAEYMYKDNDFKCLSSNVEIPFLNKDKEKKDWLAEMTKKQFIEIFTFVNAYFFHYRQDAKTIDKKKVEKHTVSKKGKYYYKEIQYIDKKYMITGRIKQNKIKTTHQWHIDNWQVRGHLRHYTNGKVVFVKPYVKGKNREELQGKTYKVHNVEAE